MIVSFRRHMLLHLDGNNHTYVHESADIEKAVELEREHRTEVLAVLEGLLSN